MKKIENIVVLIVLVLFMGTAMLLLLLNITTYQAVYKMKQDIIQTKRPIEYIVDKVREKDGISHIEVRNIQGVDVLVFQENQDGITYETWIYGYNGSLCEMTGNKLKESDIGEGKRVCTIKTLKITMESSSLLKINLIESKGLLRDYVITLRST